MAFERIDQTVISHEGGEAQTPAGVAPRPARSRWLAAADKEAEAHKLRAKGHSYRRIAEVLQVQYGLVSRWLSGLGERTYSAEEPVRRPVARAAVLVQATPDPEAPPVPVPADFLTRYQAMEQRVGDLLATLSKVALENRERENRLYKALEDERRAASDRESLLKTEIAEVRAMVELLAEERGGLLPEDATAGSTPSRPLPASGLLGRLALWRRGGVAE
jgi:hypothetical protein